MACMVVMVVCTATIPMDELRIGLAFHTPTVLSMKDAWSSTMTAYHSTITYSIPQDNQPTGSYNYRVISPLKVIGSVAYVAFRRLAMDLDLEFTSFQWIKMKTSNTPGMPTYDFKAENAAIKSLYRSVINLRLGAEYAITSRFFVRGGFAYYPSPYKKSVSGALGATSFYTLGVGYKWKKIYIDLGYKFQNWNQNYYAFNPLDSKNLTSFKNQRNNIMLTVGFPF